MQTHNIVRWVWTGLTVLIALVAVVLGLGSAAAQGDDGFTVLAEIQLDGTVTALAAASDGGVCVVTDGSVVTCYDADGAVRKGWPQKPNQQGIIGILVGVTDDVYTVEQNIDAASPPLIKRLTPDGSLLGEWALEQDGFEDLTGGSFLARTGPGGELYLLNADTSQLVRFGPAGPNQAADPPMEEVSIVFHTLSIIDFRVAPDGAVIALDQDGQLHRSGPGGGFSPLPTAFDGQILGMGHEETTWPDTLFMARNNNGGIDMIQIDLETGETLATVASLPGEPSSRGGITGPGVLSWSWGETNDSSAVILRPNQNTSRGGINAPGVLS